MDLTHINDQGRATMVDVPEKNDTQMDGSGLWENLHEAGNTGKN